MVRQPHLQRANCPSSSGEQEGAAEAREDDAELNQVANTATEGELLDLIDEFSDGRIQFAFVKVKDPNSSLPKNVLIAWVS